MVSYLILFKHLIEQQVLLNIVEFYDYLWHLISCGLVAWYKHSNATNHVRRSAQLRQY